MNNHSNLDQNHSNDNNHKSKHDILQSYNYHTQSRDYITKNIHKEKYATNQAIEDIIKENAEIMNNLFLGETNNDDKQECRIKKHEPCRQKSISTLGSGNSLVYNKDKILNTNDHNADIQIHNKEQKILEDKDLKISFFSSSENISKQGDEIRNNISYMMSIHQNDLFSPNSPMNLSVAKSLIERFENCDSNENTSCILRKNPFDQRDITDINIIPEELSTSHRSQIMEQDSKSKHNNHNGRLSHIGEKSNRLSKIGNEESSKGMTNRQDSVFNKEGGGGSSYVGHNGSRSNNNSQYNSSRNNDNGDNEIDEKNMKKTFMDDFRNLKNEVVVIQNNLKYSETYNKKLEEALANQSMQITKILQNFISLKEENELLKRNFSHLKKPIPTSQYQNINSQKYEQISADFKRNLELTIAKKVIKFQSEELILQRKKHERVSKNQDCVIQDLKKLLKEKELLLEKYKTEESIKPQINPRASSLSINQLNNHNVDDNPIAATASLMNQRLLVDDKSHISLPNLNKSHSTRHRKSIDMMMMNQPIIENTANQYYSADRNPNEINKDIEIKVDKSIRHSNSNNNNNNGQDKSKRYKKEMNYSEEFSSDDLVYIRHMEEMKEKLNSLKRKTNEINNNTSNFNNECLIDAATIANANPSANSNPCVNANANKQSKAEKNLHTIVCSSKNNLNEVNQPSSLHDDQEALMNGIDYNQKHKGIATKNIQNTQKSCIKDSIVIGPKLDELSIAHIPENTMPEMSFEMSFFRENHNSKKHDVELASFNLSPIKDSNPIGNTKGSLNITYTNVSTHNHIPNLTNHDGHIITNNNSITDSSINMNSNIMNEIAIMNQNVSPGGMQGMMISSKIMGKKYEDDNEKKEIVKGMNAKDMASLVCKPNVNMFKKDPTRIPITNNSNNEGYLADAIQYSLNSKNQNENQKINVALYEGVEYKTPKNACTTTSRLRRREPLNYSDMNMASEHIIRNAEISTDYSKQKEKKSNSANNSNNKNLSHSANRELNHKEHNNKPIECDSHFNLQQIYEDNQNSHHGMHGPNILNYKNTIEKQYDVRSSMLLNRNDSCSNPRKTGSAGILKHENEAYKKENSRNENNHDLRKNLNDYLGVNHDQRTRSKKSKGKRGYSDTRDSDILYQESFYLKNDSQNVHNSHILESGIANKSYISNLNQMARSPTVGQLQKEDSNLHLMKAKENYSTSNMRPEELKGNYFSNRETYFHGEHASILDVNPKNVISIHHQSKSRKEPITQQTRNQSSVHKKSDQNINISNYKLQIPEHFSDFNNFDCQLIPFKKEIERNPYKPERYADREVFLDKNRKHKKHKVKEISDITDFNSNNWNVNDNTTSVHTARNHQKKIEDNPDYYQKIVNSELVYRTNHSNSNKKYNRKENNSGMVLGLLSPNYINATVFNDITNNNESCYIENRNYEKNRNQNIRASQLMMNKPYTSSHERTKMSAKKYDFSDQESYYISNQQHGYKDQREYEREKGKSEKQMKHYKCDKMDDRVFDTVKKERIERERVKERQIRNENTFYKVSEHRTYDHHNSYKKHSNDNKAYSKNGLDGDSMFNKSNEIHYYDNTSLSNYAKEVKKAKI